MEICHQGHPGSPGKSAFADLLLGFAASKSMSVSTPEGVALFTATDSVDESIPCLNSSSPTPTVPSSFPSSSAQPPFINSSKLMVPASSSSSSFSSSISASSNSLTSSSSSSSSPSSSSLTSSTSSSASSSLSTTIPLNSSSTLSSNATLPLSGLEMFDLRPQAPLRARASTFSFTTKNTFFESEDSWLEQIRDEEMAAAQLLSELCLPQSMSNPISSQYNDMVKMEKLSSSGNDDLRDNRTLRTTRARSNSMPDRFMPDLVPAPRLGPNGLSKDNVMIGAYSPEERRLRIERFLEKRKHRVWTKKIKYDVRKSFADSRVRVKGRFVRKDEEVIMKDSFVNDGPHIES